MSELYERMLAAARDQTAFVSLDVDPPRDAQDKKLVAYLFEPVPDAARPQGQGIRLPVTRDQARTLLDAGAKWSGPSHLRAEVLP
jgi:hypothetical protein